ncbi:hypothetical protein CDD83_6978 [Cordyceps sp. RAO-2017]|nr:hypothetical protein CDD83_6978 [Cordyceps sp. RAO-2017]
MCWARKRSLASMDAPEPPRPEFDSGSSPLASSVRPRLPPDAWSRLFFFNASTIGPIWISQCEPPLVHARQVKGSTTDSPSSGHGRLSALPLPKTVLGKAGHASPSLASSAAAAHVSPASLPRGGRPARERVPC